MNLEENNDLICELSYISDDEKDNLKSSIIKFVCYFNLFESYLNERGIDHWYDFFDKYTVDESLINKYFEFFYKRYVKDDEVNDQFNSFYGVVKENYLNQLKNDLIQKQNKPKSVLSISYYFRNNLFHGHKAICQLKKYVACFEKITEFLLKIMENAKEKK